VGWLHYLSLAIAGGSIRAALRAAVLEANRRPEYMMATKEAARLPAGLGFLLPAVAGRQPMPRMGVRVWAGEQQSNTRPGSKFGTQDKGQPAVRAHKLCAAE